jgi:hypothetical protein
MTCLQAANPAAALPVLEYPITNIDLHLSDLVYNDNLMYHYTGGVILAMLKRWSEAEEFFEITATAPGSVPAALQMEALKKLRLVQLISKGKVCSHLLLPSRSVSMRLVVLLPRSLLCRNTHTRFFRDSSRLRHTINSSLPTRTTSTRSKSSCKKSGLCSRLWVHEPSLLSFCSDTDSYRSI